VIRSIPTRPRSLALLGSATLLLAAGGAALLAAPEAQAASLFQVGEVQQDRFVLVSALIGDGSRAQLNIYEQVKATRPCFAVGAGRPAPVDPLLAQFDFTGICSRFIDANGYSVRVGGSDLGTVYRLSVIKANDDTLLMAIPTKAGAGPEMVVARTQGVGSGFLKFELEPGWRLMRRHFGNRALGHVYLYRDAWPSESQAAATAPEQG
jgi:nitrogen fixation protein